MDMASQDGKAQDVHTDAELGYIEVLPDSDVKNVKVPAEDRTSLPEMNFKSETSFISGNSDRYIKSTAMEGSVGMKHKKPGIRPFSAPTRPLEKQRSREREFRVLRLISTTSSLLFTPTRCTNKMKILLGIIAGIIVLTVIIVVSVMLTRNEGDSVIRVFEQKEEWTTWSIWSICSVTCGTGVATRTRNCTISANIPKSDSCQGADTQEKICFETTCPGLIYFHLL